MSKPRARSNLRYLPAPVGGAVDSSEIEEGCGKRTRPQLRNSLDIAGGSLSELEYWFTLGRDLAYMPPELYVARAEQLNEVRRLLLGFTDWSSG